MHRKIRQLKLVLIRCLIEIYCIIFNNSKNKKVAIISCFEWKNKVLEDIKLRYYLSKKHINADIVAWECEMNYTKYDAIIIRSVWGFEPEKFKRWLKDVSTQVKIINEYDLINNNFSKKNQFEILNKYGISHIPTQHIKCDNSLSKSIKDMWDSHYSNYDKLVIKPDISESGNNTFILTRLENIKNSIDFNELSTKFSNKDIEVLIQPYIEEIKNGEISIIIFNKKILHAVIRYPGVFTNECYSTQIEFNEISKEVLKLTDKIINLNEFSGFTYMRVDFIKKENEYLILEIELIDPLLFINSIKRKEKRKFTYKLFSSEIKKVLNSD